MATGQLPPHLAAAESIFPTAREGYGDLRQRFNLVFFNYLSQSMTIANYIGGQRFTRLDPWPNRWPTPL
ncbi:hypothetical protein [Halomicronema hongdechloris]|uniref:hypothetical protein n=1 Tax=Halomicronema hongdechloris TaxID=1209493 RepID=UPI0010CBF062|nr:hypothetical protein [Halomicronema hongdechloris]